MIVDATALQRHCYTDATALYASTEAYMSVSGSLGEQDKVDTPAGTIEYRERGSGPALVFVHGIVVNGDLWRNVVPELADGYRCIAPDLPFGSHSIPLRADADLSIPGLAAIIDGFLEALGLDDATLVANDTGGAVSQWLAAKRPQRVGRLVLTSCDAFDNFLPAAFAYLKPTARLGAATWIAAQSMSLKPVQRMPIAYGWATSAPIEKPIMESYTGPLRHNAAIRRDFRRLIRAVDNRYTREAADGLGSFDKPALVAWAAEDKFFPVEHGRRLADLLPQGRFELIPEARAFIPEDQPQRLARVVREFLEAAS